MQTPRHTVSLIALSICLTGCLPAAEAQTAQEKIRPAKDMRYRKRVIVAPTGAEIPRRIDYQSLGTRDALLLPNHLPRYGMQNNQPVGSDDGGLSQSARPGGVVPSSSGVVPRANRDGIVPPPPPGQSNLLPRSLTTTSGDPASQSAESASARSINPPVKTDAHLPLSASKLAQIKNEANLLARRGKLADAQTLLERYHHQYPQDTALKGEIAKVALARSKAYTRSGDHAMAAKFARISAGYAGHSPELGAAAAGALDSSISKLGVNPKNAEQRANLGDKLSAQNRHGEALVEYRAAAKLNPSEAHHLKAGNAAASAGQHLEAKAAYQDALELNPESAQVLRQLGLTRYKMRDFSGASADLTRALVLNPDDRQAAASLTALWREQVESRPNDPNSHLGLARALQVSGDLPQAQSEYKKVVQLNPGHPHLPAARQSFKLALAKQEARKAFDAAHRLEGEGSLPAAYQKATDAVGLYPSDASYKKYWEGLADKLRAQGLPAQANLALSPQAASQIAALAQPGEQPAAAALPTAQNLGLATTPQAQQAQFASENGYRPMNSDTQVTSISSFLTTMRDFTVQQQSQINAASLATRQALKSLGGAEVPVTTTTTTTTTVADTPEEALASAKQALGNTTALGMPALSTPALSTSAMKQSLLDSARQAVNNGTVTNALSSAGSRFGFGQQATPAALPVASADIAPPVAPVFNQVNQITQVEGAVPAIAAAPVISAPPALSATPTQITETPQLIQTMREAAPQKYLNEAPAQEPKLALKPALPLPPKPEHAARLYLSSVKAGKGDVQLKVTMQNIGSNPLKLPGTADATIHAPGKADQSVKVSFGSRNLPVGGSVSGTIKVPGSSLDPSADIYIPGKSLVGTNLDDLHLTVPISQK